MDNRERPIPAGAQHANGRDRHGRRPFNILDGLILLMPVAFGFALARPNLVRSNWHPPDEWISRWTEILGHNLEIASPFACAGMVGLLVVRLRRPRPGLVRLSRQPGAVACATGVTAMAAGGIVVGAMQMSQAYIPFQPNSAWPIFVAWIPPAVITAWATMILGHRWRAEASWIDRAGRICGCYWIAHAICRWATLVAGR